MNRPDKAIERFGDRPDHNSTQDERDAFELVEYIDYLEHRNTELETRRINVENSWLAKFKQLKHQLAQAPREVTGDQLTDEMLVWEISEGPEFADWSQSLNLKRNSDSHYIVKPKPVEEDADYEIVGHYCNACSQLALDVADFGVRNEDLTARCKELEKEHSQCPREITGERLTDDYLVWASYGAWLDAAEINYRSDNFRYIGKPKQAQEPGMSDNPVTAGYVQVEEEARQTHTSTHCTRCRELQRKRDEAVKQLLETENRLAEMQARCGELEKALVDRNKHAQTLWDELRHLQNRHIKVVAQLPGLRDLYEHLNNTSPEEIVEVSALPDYLRRTVKNLLDLLQPPQQKTVEEVIGDEQLDEIRERNKRRTQGEWEPSFGVHGDPVVAGSDKIDLVSLLLSTKNPMTTARLTANSSPTAPAITNLLESLDEIKRQLEEIIHEVARAQRTAEIDSDQAKTTLIAHYFKGKSSAYDWILRQLVERGLDFRQNTTP